MQTKKQEADHAAARTNRVRLEHSPQEVTNHVVVKNIRNM